MIEEIKQAMENIGILTDDVTEDTLMGDILNDSLTFTSFYVELEVLMQIDIPEDIFLINWKNKKLIDFKNILEDI